MHCSVVLLSVLLCSPSRALGEALRIEPHILLLTDFSGLIFLLHCDDKSSFQVMNTGGAAMLHSGFAKRTRSDALTWLKAVSSSVECHVSLASESIDADKK